MEKVYTGIKNEEYVFQIGIIHLSNFAKWSTVCFPIKWLWVRVPLQSLIIHLVRKQVFAKN